MANTVFNRSWETAQKVDPSRYLAANILTSKNANAGAFGSYDTVKQDPQTIISTAAWPWSWYVVSVNLSYQEVRSIQGPNERTNLVSTQLQNAIGSISDTMGTDLTSLAKGNNFGTGYNSLGILEAADDSTNVATYGGISRTAFTNWKAFAIFLATTGIGNTTNDASWQLFTRLYVGASVGAEAPTVVFSSKDGIAAYMFLQGATGNNGMNQMRVAPMDEANLGFSGAMLYRAEMVADDHIANVSGTGGGAGKTGCLYAAINENHTMFYYFGKKGFDYIPFVDQQGVVGRIARYVTVEQYASTQPRLNGQLNGSNTLANL